MILRELTARRRALKAARSAAAEAVGEARRRTALARTVLGGPVLEGAGAAQPCALELRRHHARLVGVALPRLEAHLGPARPSWSLQSTSRHLDDAAAAWRAALPHLVALAGEEAAVRALEEGLRRTTRRQGALERVVLPGLEAELRAIGQALEEEARDEALRRRRAPAARRRRG